MSLAWIPFIGVTIFLFGVGQVFTKTGTTRLGSPGMLLLLSFNMFIIYGGAWLVFHKDGFVPFTDFLYCIIAAALSAVGYIHFLLLWLQQYRERRERYYDVNHRILEMD